MTSAKPRVERKTLWSHGARGSAEWMRVVHDSKQGRVEVHYKDATGVRRKRIFPEDRKGKSDAITWAEAFRDERTRLGMVRTDTTHAELWAAYTSSPAWANLRETSKPSYTERWAKWQNARGAATRPNDTTLHHIDQFIMRARAAGTAINQIRQVLNVARLVYNWGLSRKLITENAFAGYRWQTPKDAAVIEPDEYTPDEYAKILAQLSPQSSRQWRAHVAVLIAGQHGGRARAVLNLDWSVVDGDEIVWPPAFQKNGKALRQPLTWDLVAALETARYWRAQAGYQGPWILFGGRAASRGVVRTLLDWEKDPMHKRVGRGKKKAWLVSDRPYSYQGLISMLHAAERAAGVTPKKYRGVHGLRKHAAGNVADVTGDATLAMRWIGDDIRQAPRYLKKRDEQMARAAAATERKSSK